MELIMFLHIMKNYKIFYLKTLKRYLTMDIKGIGIASYGFVKGNEAKETIKLGLSIFNQWYDTIKHLHNQGHSLDQICDEIIKIFGKSPGEIRENRPDTWIKGFLKSSIQGFIDSGMEDAKKK